MDAFFPPLMNQEAIVDKDGKPTLYFQRFMQHLQAGGNLTVTNGVVGVENLLAYHLWGNTTNYWEVDIDSGLLFTAKNGAFIEFEAGGVNPLGFWAASDVNFTTYWGIGAIKPSGRRTIEADVSFEFQQQPYYLNSKIFHEGNLSFGSGLTYNALTGVLTASGGGAGSTPTVRASNIQSSSNSSYTVTWPTGTIAGDVVFIFGGHGFGFNNPANWIVLDNETGSNFNGAVFAKVMTAADILAGSVTVTTAGAFNGILAAVTVTGTTMAGIRQPSAFVRNGAGPGAATATSITNQAPFALDLILAFAASRVAGNITFSAGITSLQAINAASASGAVGKFTGTLTALGMVETWQSSVAGSGYYTAAVALRGP